MAHLFSEQRQRRFRLCDVVGSRRPAANFRVWQFYKIKLRNRAEQSARSLTDLLPVKQVARILIRDTLAQRIEFSPEPQFCEKLGDIAHLGHEGTSLCVFRFSGREKMII